MVQRLGGGSVLWFVTVVAMSTSSKPLQSAGHANHMGSLKPSASSLVGDTMSSTNDVPFDWSSDYEMAVVYITSAWTEFGDVRSPDAPLGIIAENGFLNYCVRFKTKLAAWAKSLQDRPDVSETVKKAVSSWYRAIDTLSQDNWNLPAALTLESFRKQFMTAYKHLVLNGAEIYEKSDSEIVKRDVDGFTRDVADTMIGILKGISNLCCRNKSEAFPRNATRNINSP
ncbi:uncharacterized protein LOC103307644 [Acyrthosiphon pisum]|uniref:Uncharacterized protein n=1 Tax=Acyrthosiphon pisum TaxID=7029 RepID=A0A8R2D3X5_ACYPI|nr:uncharacterized protein LOC103307644 [Acyrthosiphon pisum]|eukprot:XP_016658726.1 PREDICTED: uncharacterized protein LOC103307644 [Acyrthosiphon pisum]